MKNLITLLFIGFALHAYAQRNVILIIADDLGSDYCGFYEGHIDTAALPNIMNDLRSTFAILKF